VRLSDVATISVRDDESAARVVADSPAVLLIVHARPDIDADWIAAIGEVVESDVSLLVSRPYRVSRCSNALLAPSSGIAIVDVRAPTGARRAELLDALRPALSSNAVLLQGSRLLGATDSVQLIGFVEGDVRAEQLVKSWLQVIEGRPSMTATVIEPRPRQVRVHIEHDDMETMLHAREAVEQDARPHSIALFTQGAAREPTIQVRPDRHALARHGIAQHDLAQLIRASLYGVQVTAGARAQTTRPIVLTLGAAPTGDFEERVRKLRALNFIQPDGRQVPLLGLADVSLEPAPSSIERHDGRRRLTVTADVRSPEDARTIASTLASKTIPELTRTHPGMTITIVQD